MNRTNEKVDSSSSNGGVEGGGIDKQKPLLSQETTNNNPQTKNEQQQQHNHNQQDGKRTLIKNQLYLIEQLQLENANLRNERDQLQLENEELKFQLQMISSSNILTQPGASFGSNTGNTSNTNQHHPSALEPGNHLPHHPVVNNPIHLHQSNRIIQEEPAHENYIANIAALDEQNSYIENQIKLLATPLRQPLSNHNVSRGYLINKTPLVRIADHGMLENQQQSQQPVLTRAKTTTNVVEQSQLYNQNQRQNQNQSSHLQQKQQVRLKTAASLNDCSKLLASSNCSSSSSSSNQRMLTPADSYSSTLISGSKFSIAGQTTTLTAFNVKNLIDPLQLPQSRNLPQDEEEEQRIKLVVQRYGSDSEKIQSSAIMIQRAFRKYQICKRFRTITEQLRLNTSTSSTETSGISLLSTNTNDSISSSTKQSDESTTELPYASGATKAAALESLSFAAQRLAAAAAKQQQLLQISNNNNGGQTTNSRQDQSYHHQQQQILSSINSQTKTAAGLGQHPPTQTTTPIIRSKQHDPVVAAAINFQQLESIRKRQYRVGLNIFNKNPEKGVSFLIAHSFIDSSSPYTKKSTSYYHSNQLYFIDSKQNQHHQLAQQIALAPLSNNYSSNYYYSAINDNLTQPACQICVEEDNLKRNVAHFLLHRKGLAKEKIGSYLGNLQSEFNQSVLKYYLLELDFNGLQIDLALRKFLSTFRLPGEAQKIEAIVDNFACRYVQCQQQPQQAALLPSGLVGDPGGGNIVIPSTQPTSNPATNQTEVVTNNNKNNNLILLSKDEIFILTFAIIMLNTDLHSPSLKPTSRMSSAQFVNNLRGVFKSQTINESDLLEIYERVKANQITTTPDHVSHVMKVQQGLTVTNFQKKELPNLCVPHRRLVCFCRLFEVYDVNKKERLGQHQREIFLFNDLLLVTKLVRRVRTNTNQLYTYRQSISLQGLYVQLFQSPHYNYGIKLCQRSNDETLIMFNARNELDQSRFVDDLGESIAEMDEMENIKANNVIETIHSKYQERLRRHSMMHNNNCIEEQHQQQLTIGGNDNNQKNRLLNNMINKSCDIRISNNNNGSNISRREQIMRSSENNDESSSVRLEAVEVQVSDKSSLSTSSSKVDAGQRDRAAADLDSNKSDQQQQVQQQKLQEPSLKLEPSSLASNNNHHKTPGSNRTTPMIPAPGALATATSEPVTFD